MGTASYELQAGTWSGQLTCQKSTDQSAERREMVKMAMSQGVPLHQIEEYLDWQDAVQVAGNPGR